MATVDTERKVVAEGEAPPGIDDHAFVPRAQWWSLCKICGLAEAAHLTTTIDSLAEIRADHERQAEWREAELRRLHSGGRARIGYYGDDNEDE